MRAEPMPSGPSLQSCMSVLAQGTMKLPCPSSASPHSPSSRVFPDTTDPHKGPTPAKSPTAPVPSRKTTPWVLSGQALLPAPSLSAKVGRWSRLENIRAETTGSKTAAGQREVGSQFQRVLTAPLLQHAEMGRDAMTPRSYLRRRLG